MAGVRAPEEIGGAEAGTPPAGAASQAPERLEPLEAAWSSHVPTDDGVRLFCEVHEPREDARRARPVDAPPVLLVIGLGGNGRLWAPATRRLLAAGYEVITFDNRGCGSSSIPAAPFSTRRMARDAATVLDALGIERAHVGAASLGGMVAQELALEFPERVGSLVLLATTGGFGRPPELSAWRALARILEASARSARAGDDLERQVREYLRVCACEEFAHRCGPGEESWEAVAAALEHPPNPRGTALQLLAALRHSTWSRLERLRMPVQIHHGTEDRLIPVSAGVELARRIPGARLEVHPGAGHGIFERTDEVGRSIVAFLGACDAATA